MDKEMMFFVKKIKQVRGQSIKKTFFNYTFIMDCRQVLQPFA